VGRPTDYERRNLNNPTIAWRKWTAATRVKKPKPRSAGVSATEHGRAQGTIDQQQARIEELEQEVASARQVLPPLTWQRAMRFLIDELPYVEPDTAREDWPSEFADLVRQIVETGSMDRAERLREAVAAVEDEEPSPAVEEPAAAAGAAGRLVWAGNDDEGYLARAPVEGKYRQMYTVVPVIFQGCEHFEARVISDSSADLPLKRSAGASLYRYDAMGQRHTIGPVPTAAEAKELCEIAYAHGREADNGMDR
jgi:hypothetical protein